METPNITALTSECCASDTQDKICRTRGGESCAFDGAMIVLQPIADAAHLVHGPITCAGNSWEGRGTLSDKGSLHLHGFTTDMRELDIIYGSEDKLYDAILQTHDSVSPKAIFIYSTCVSGLIGEDIDMVAKKTSDHLGIPVIPVNAPGFAGPKNLGNRIAGEVLLEHVIGTGEPAELTGTEINIIGEYNIAGDLWKVEPLLREAGIRVLSRITGNASYEEITYAHRARLNVLVCGRALINVARTMEARYGIPYVEASFFGHTGMARSLRAISAALGDKDISAKVEGIISRQEEELESDLQEYSYFDGMKAVLYSGGVKSWAMIETLRDLGFSVAAVGVKKSSADDEKKIRALVGDSVPVVENVTPASLLSLMSQCGAELMVAGGRNLYLGHKEGFPFIDVNQERHSAYAGYDGLRNLARDIHKSMVFYNRAPKREETNPVVSVKGKALLMDPLKHSQSLGAVLAVQGVDRVLPVWHGAQGCNFLGKVLLSKHYREPVAVISSRLFVEDIVMSSEEKATHMAIEGASKHSPDLVCAISSALTEIKGDRMQELVSAVIYNTHATAINVSAPDYKGDMETGYVATVEALLDLVESGHDKPAMPSANILVGPDITPADCLEIKEMVESFGLSPIILPDLSALDGTMRHVSALTSGGTTLKAIRSMGTAEVTFAIGACMHEAAQLLQSRHGVMYHLFEGLDGLVDTDAFMNALSALSGFPVPARYLRQRQVLQDAMRDASSRISDKRVCLALPASHALRISRLLSELGMSVPLCVIPDLKPYANRIQASAVIAGGLSAVEGDFDLMISNSHAVDHASALGIPLYHAGFPSYKQFGATLKKTVGYEGSLNTTIELANHIMEVN